MVAILFGLNVLIIGIVHRNVDIAPNVVMIKNAFPRHSVMMTGLYNGHETLVCAVYLVTFLYLGSIRHLPPYL